MEWNGLYRNEGRTEWNGTNGTNERNTETINLNRTKRTNHGPGVSAGSKKAHRQRELINTSLINAHDQECGTTGCRVNGRKEWSGWKNEGTEHLVDWNGLSGMEGMARTWNRDRPPVFGPETQQFYQDWIRANLFVGVSAARECSCNNYHAILILMVK